MPSYSYMVTVSEGRMGGDHGPDTVTGSLDGQPWTHATATAWAHTEGSRLPSGTRIQILRRPYRARWTERSQVAHSWMPHRDYTVQPNGITVRTDR